MADFFLIAAEDPAVIDRAVAGVSARLAEIAPRGIPDRLTGPGWALLTVRSPAVPYLISSSPQGTAMVIGSAGPSDRPGLQDLLEPNLESRVTAARRHCLELDFGVVLSLHNGDIVLASDWLGLFPVYYRRSAIAFVATSIPALAEWAGDASLRIDLQGLVSLLLMAHVCLDRTLYEGVARLRSGHLLKFDTRRREVTLDEVPLGMVTPAPADLGEAIDAFDGALSSVVAETVRQGTRSIFLSGGLDSRIIAGYLHQAHPESLLAVTAGDRNDVEMRAAARVVSRIGAVHKMVPVRQIDYPSIVQRLIDEDGLTSGLYVLTEWAVSEALQGSLLTGFLGDAVMGARHAYDGREPACDLQTFHALFNALNASGLSPGVVRELVRSEDIDDLIREVQAGLHRAYDSAAGDSSKKTWWFDLLHRQRFLVGHLPKVLALGAWPVLPYARPAVVRLAASTPLEVLSDRKVQIGLIRRRFPDLASQPLARDIDHVLYRLPGGRETVPSRLADRLRSSASWWAHRWFDLPERRPFFRSFDFNGSGWQALRNIARETSSQTASVFNQELALHLIPHSSEKVRFKRVITDATGRKTLIGAILVAERLVGGRE